MREIHLVKLLIVTGFIIITHFSFGQNVDSESTWDPIVDAKLTRFSTKWSQKDKPIDAWAKHIKYGFVNYGVLYGVTDTTIKLAKHRDLTYSVSHAEHKDIHIKDIKYLLLREPKRKIKYLLGGIIVGLATGVGIVAIKNPKGDFFTPTIQYYVVGGAIGAATGALSGIILGSMKLKIPIKGSKSNFDKSKERLRAISMQK